MMKETFKQGDRVLCPNIKVKEFLIDYAINKGVSVYSYTIENKNHPDHFEEYESLYFNDSNQICGGTSKIKGNLTIEQFIKYCDNWKELGFKADKTVFLTCDYQAVINFNDKHIKVGCQSIPFSTVEEIYNLIKESENE